MLQVERRTTGRLDEFIPFVGSISIPVSLDLVRDGLEDERSVSSIHHLLSTQCCRLRWCELYPLPGRSYLPGTTLEGSSPLSLISFPEYRTLHTRKVQFSVLR